VRPKAQVKLPATACKPHASDNGVETAPDVAAEAWPSEARSYESLLIEHYRRPGMETSVQHETRHSTLEVVSDPAEDVLDEATATNLWRILDSRHPNLLDQATENTFSAIMTPLPAETPGEFDAPLLFASSEHFCQSPFELDGREVPYVHANSLTGYCNGNSEEALPIPDYREQIWTDDFGIGVPTVRYADDLTGLNELMMDHDMNGSGDLTSWPTKATPAAPETLSPVLSGSSLMQELPADYVADDTERTASDAHFQSEQALFAQSPPLSLKPLSDANQSAISIGDFLKLGHARECWCGFCSDQAETATENDTSSTKVAVDDEVDSDISLDLNSDSQAETPELVSPDDSDAMTDADEGWLLYSTDAVTAEEGRSDVYLPSSPVLHQPPESLHMPIVTVCPHHSTDPEVAKHHQRAWDPVDLDTCPIWVRNEIMASSAAVESDSDVDASEWDEMWEGDLL